MLPRDEAAPQAPTPEGTDRSSRDADNVKAQSSRRLPAELGIVYTATYDSAPHDCAGSGWCDYPLAFPDRLHLLERWACSCGRRGREWSDFAHVYWRAHLDRVHGGVGQ